MLAIADLALDSAAEEVLGELQTQVNSAGQYANQVSTAVELWNAKANKNLHRGAFLSVRRTLARMCVGSVRCAYCEDSLADEIEHIKPKTIFPEVAFVWHNYLFACGPCNGPKGNRYAYVSGKKIVEFVRKRGDLVVPPPNLISALIDPRREDPIALLDLDLGGTTRDGITFEGTFEILPAMHLSVIDRGRAEYTIKLLGLNREVIREARANAFSGFKARLREYVRVRELGSDQRTLEIHRDDILRTPHLTVFVEMRRQRAIIPEIMDILERAPEIMIWPTSLGN